VLNTHSPNLEWLRAEMRRKALSMQKLANSAWFLLILIATLPHSLDAIALPASQADVPPSSVLELKPVLDLAHRVVPWMDGKLILIRIPKERGDDVFDLRTEAGKLVIRASDPSSAAKEQARTVVESETGSGRIPKSSTWRTSRITHCDR